MKNKSKKIMVILAIVIVLIIASIVIPMIVKGGSSSAQKAQVLSSKTFTSDVAGVATQGAMTNYGDAVLTKQVDAEGEDYIANIDLDDGYYESIQINAKPIYDRGVSAGADALPKKAAQTYTPTTSNQTIEEGQYLTGAQTIKGDANLKAANIKKGVSIFGVTGSYDNSATANSFASYTTYSNSNGTEGARNFTKQFSLSKGSYIISISGGSNWHGWNAYTVTVSGGTKKSLGAVAVSGGSAQYSAYVRGELYYISITNSSGTVSVNCSTTTNDSSSRGAAVAVVISSVT